jgi:uncharacterized protein (DUF2236 family)
MMWKVVRHRSILLHGPAAAVLQIAHPRIGLGVMQHSAFETDPLSRLDRTLAAVYAISFGTHEDANRAAQVVAARHAGVKGDASAAGVPGPASYSADEIDLLMWVVATLVWSAVSSYERTVGELTRDEKERFYRDMRTLGTYFNLPTDYGPQNWDDFQRYFDQQIADPLIGSHEVSRRVAWAVARPQTPLWFRAAALPITFLFSEIIPPPVRDRLGFRSTRLSRAGLAVATVMLRATTRFTPNWIRYVPEYRRAVREVNRTTSSPSDCLSTRAMKA